MGRHAGNRAVESLVIQENDRYLHTKPLRGVLMNVGQIYQLGIGEPVRVERCKLVNKEGGYWTWRKLYD